MSGQGIIVSILPFQETAEQWYWCRECAAQHKLVTPVTMRAELLTCPSCLIDGMMVANAGRAESFPDHRRI